VDLYGDPLPEGAVMRLGTLRQRAVGAQLAVSADGKSIIGVRGGKLLSVWDTATGKLRQTRELPGESWGRSELSSDGRWVVTDVGMPDPHLKLWDAGTGKPGPKLAIERARYVMPVAFSKDGKRLAAVGHWRGKDGKYNHLVRAWNLATGKEVFSKKVNINVASDLLAFSPDGKHLLTSFGSTSIGMFCWDIATGRQLWQNKEISFDTMVFTPDGKILTSQQNPQLVDLETGKAVALEKLSPINWSTHLSLTPDGRTLLISSARGVIVWDLANGKELRMLKGAGEQIVVMPDGKSIVTNNGSLQRWDLATGKPLYADTSILGHVGEVVTLAFSADGKRLVSGSTDGSVRLWDTTTGQSLRIWHGHEARRPVAAGPGAGDGVKTVDITPDGRRVLSAGNDDRIKLWDASKDKEVRAIALPAPEKGEGNRHVYHVRFSPDGTRVIGTYGPQGGFMSAASTVRQFSDKVAIWDAKTGGLLAIHPVYLSGGRSSGLSTDGWTLLALGKLVDVASGKEKVRLTGISRFSSAALSPDGSLVIGNAEERTTKNGTTYVNSAGLRVWEAATGRPVVNLKSKSWIAQVAFHPDHRFIVTNDLDGIQLRDVITGAVVARLTMPQKVRVGTTRGSYASCLAFTKNGRRLATGHPDSTILLWDFALPASKVKPLTAKELETLWSDLVDTVAAKAWQAVWRMSDAPNEVLPFLRARLKPYPTAPADVTRKLLADLDDNSFERREAAMKRLKDLGLQAEPALRATLKLKPSLEQKKRIEQILAALKVASPPTAEELRQLRAVIVLERLRSPEARRVLEAMTNGPPSARQTRQAFAALSCLR
jgi:WD40 repeat protein